MAYTTIDDPSAYFQTVLWTGNGSARSITLDGNSDMQPDWVWLKRRNSARNHALLDSVRGGTKQLISNSTAAEGTDAQLITSFDSDGFSLGTSNDCNSSGDTFVGWNWLAGGTASSNTDGSITSTVSASTDAGFSIVSWTGNGSAATIGHGLGSAPKVVIIKSRDNAHAWFVGHESLGWTKYMTLENANAINDDVIWNDTAPTSSVFSVGGYSSTNGSGVKFIGYCFAEKKGYSKFGSYTGNNNADGPFVFTGFLPAFIMMKSTSTGGDNAYSWSMFDNKRSSYNIERAMLKANLSDAEYTSGSNADVDILSNGFKMRASPNETNGANTYIYMAFAESPFVTSTGIPTTAR